MKERWRRFMMGRYGSDSLNRALLILSLVLLVLSWVLDRSVFWLLALVVLVLAYCRMFSRNLYRRQQENQRYLQATAGLRKEARLWRRKWQDRRTHVYFKCPYCREAMRVPKGQGRVMVRCRKCGREFEKVS